MCIDMYLIFTWIECHKQTGHNGRRRSLSKSSYHINLLNIPNTLLVPSVSHDMQTGSGTGIYAPAEQEVTFLKEEPAVAPVTCSAKEEMLGVFSRRRAASQIAEINHNRRQSSCLPHYVVNVNYDSSSLLKKAECCVFVWRGGI